MQAINSLSSSAKEIVGNKLTLGIFFVVYLALIGAAALFVVTNLATFRAVFFTFISMLFAPAIFFLLQTMCVKFAANVDAKKLLVDSIKNFWKLFLVSLPVIALAVLFFRLSLLADNTNIIVSILRFLLFAFIFPLTLIHLWIETFRSNRVVEALKNFTGVLSRAFSPLSVLIYFCGLIVFAFIPYVLLSPQIKLQQSNIVIALFVIRLVLASLLIFFGWVTTVSALTKNRNAE